MTRKKATNIYDSLYGSGTIGVRDWLCNCCGARAKEAGSMPDMTKNKRGILVAAGLIHAPYQGDKVEVTTIQTKNGPLTVSVRHVF
jgi:hypothetical protein